MTTDLRDDAVSDVPAVTIVVITYNHERYVDDCMRGVAAQTFQDLEVIVVDDASTDGTVGRVRPWLERLSCEVRLIVNDRNLGCLATHNRALGAAQGTFLSFTDGDDYYEPDKVERQHAAFSTLDESVAVVYSGARVVSDDGEPTGTWFRDGLVPAEGRVFDRLIEGNFIPKPAVMMRRASVLEVGGYDEALFYDDYDLWLRLADRHEFRYVPGEVANYRWSPGGLSRSPESAARMHRSRAQLLMKWSERDPQTRDVVRTRAWENARRAFALDPALGRPLLREVTRVYPSASRRALTTAAQVPGSSRLLRAMLAARDGAKARRHTP